VNLLLGDYALGAPGGMNLLGFGESPGVVVPVDSRLVGVTVHQVGTGIDTDAGGNFFDWTANIFLNGVVLSTNVFIGFTATQLATDSGATFEMRDGRDASDDPLDPQFPVNVEAGQLLQINSTGEPDTGNTEAWVTFHLRPTGRVSKP
jgi:hypothetical protein